MLSWKHLVTRVTDFCGVLRNTRIAVTDFAASFLYIAFFIMLIASCYK